MALATPTGGRLRHGSDLTLGGFHDFFATNYWRPDDLLGHIEIEAGADIDEDSQLPLFMMAGRRATGLAEVRSGLLTGWFDRSRASRVNDPGPIGTLLNLGTCEMEAIRGERFAFLEMLEAIRGPAQLVNVGDLQLVHNARVVGEQILRTDDERGAIACDLAETLAAGSVTPHPADWIFAGAMLDALEKSPASERYTILARDGLRLAGPPDAIVLSVNAEDPTILRHRRLGYAAQFHSFKLADAGPAFVPWLRAQFEPVRRTVHDIGADYRALIDLIRARSPATQILICNIMSTSGRDDNQSYAAFDAPIGEKLASVHSKDLNLMLCDLARERDIAIIDADAMAAELGGRFCLSDGVHQNGAMQAEMRGEILRILRARGVPGFGAAPVS
ncbi:MAG: hypothetical protein ACHP7N_03400 [Caulobacterales bacterium]